MSSKKPKIYVYVDETGQDTKGDFFIVVCIIIVGLDNKEQATQLLEKIEKQTNKKTKWHRTSKKAKTDYLSKLTQISNLKIYVKIFKNDKNYFLNTVKAIIQSIKNINNFQQYKFVIIIDGLPKTKIHQAKKLIREHKIQIDKLKGLKDEQDSLLRLADNIAGLVREIRKNHNYLFNNFQKLSSKIKFVDKNKTPKLGDLIID